MLGCIFSNLLRRTVGTDPDDLWDFGTVRHVARPGTIGRANAKTENGLTYPQPVSDLNNNHVPHHNGVRPASASKSSLSTTSTVTTKAELPRPPAHPPAYQEQDQATVRTSRREREGSYDSNQSSGSEGEGSDSERQAETRQHLADTQLVDKLDVELDDDLDGRTMLESQFSGVTCNCFCMSTQ